LEAELHETDLMHRLILNSCSDIIVKLSTDMKILEFNPEAEKIFYKKRKDVINQNFIRIFIPEAVQKKTETEINKLIKNKLESKYKMQIVNEAGNISFIEWSVYILLNNEIMPTGLLMITKSKQSHD
jgi:PAS domain S-box-containing protein